MSGFREWIDEGSGKVVVIVVALVLIGVAVWAGVRQWNQTGSPAARRVAQAGQTALFYCDGCKESGEITVAYDVQWPTACEKCGEQKAYSAFKCRNCPRIIKNTGGATVVCPHCRYRHVTQSMPGGIPAPPPIR